MKCAGCQQEIEVMSFESPQGRLCLNCRINVLENKVNHHYWLCALMGILVLLSFLFSALIIQNYQGLPFSAVWINGGLW